MTRTSSLVRLRNISFLSWIWWKKVVILHHFFNILVSLNSSFHFLYRFSCFLKVEKILEGSLDSILSPSVKNKILGGIASLKCKGKTFLGIGNKLLKKKVCWHHPAMVCLYTWSKLSRPEFEFSLKVKVLGLNPGYLLKPFLL